MPHTKGGFYKSKPGHRRKKSSKKGQSFVSAKISKIKHEGIRGKKVSQDQAIAVALSMARKKGLKVGRPR